MLAYPPRFLGAATLEAIGRPAAHAMDDAVQVVVYNVGVPNDDWCMSKKAREEPRPAARERSDREAFRKR